MPETTETEATTESTEETTETTETEAPEETTPKGGDDAASIEKLTGALDKERTDHKAAKTRAREAEAARDAAAEKLTTTATERDEAKAKIAEAERERDTAKSDLLRITVALDAGLDHTLAPRLRGDTPEELAADAKELAAQMGTGGGGLDGGARTTSKTKGTPDAEHGKFIGRLLTGQDPTSDDD